MISGATLFGRPHHVLDVAQTPDCGMRHYVFDVALSRGKYRTVGADLSAKAAFQSLNLHRLYHLFADKSAPTKSRFFSGLQVV